jgi:hypothetical protein
MQSRHQSPAVCFNRSVKHCASLRVRPPLGKVHRYKLSSIHRHCVQKHLSQNSLPKQSTPSTSCHQPTPARNTNVTLMTDAPAVASSALPALERALGAAWWQPQLPVGLSFVAVFNVSSCDPGRQHHPCCGRTCVTQYPPPKKVTYRFNWHPPPSGVSPANI